MLLRCARAVRALSLGLWAGGILMTFIAAKAIFSYFLVEGTTTAGSVVGFVLHTAMPFKIGIALLALFAEAIVFFDRSPEAPKGWRKFVPATLLMLALAAMLVVALWLQPELESLRKQIRVFDASTEGTPLRQKFGSLHGASMGLGLLEGLLVAAALILGLL